MHPLTQRAEYHHFDTHPCGQVLETILTLEDATITVTRPLPFERVQEVHVSLEATGYKVEYCGVRLEEHRFLCLTCGQDVLFGAKSPTQE